MYEKEKKPAKLRKAERSEKESSESSERMERKGKVLWQARKMVTRVAKQEKVVLTGLRFSVSQVVCAFTRLKLY